MRKSWQMFATFVLVAAIAVSGHAGPGNGNGGGNGKGNKPNKEQKEKGPKGPKGNKSGDKEAKQAEKEARKAEKLAQKEARKAAKAEEKARKQEERLAKKAAKDAAKNPAYSIAEIIVTDSRIVDLTGDYLLEAVWTFDDGTTASTSTDLSLVQDARGSLVGTAVAILPDGTVVEIPVVGGIELSGKTDLKLNLAGELADGSASLDIDGTWDGSGFQSVVTVTNFADVVSYDAVIIPNNAVVGFIIEAPLSEQVIGNKVWSDRTVVLPWGTEVVRSQLMTKKGMKFMMHSGNFGIDLRGSVDQDGLVDLSRAKLHLGYGTLWLDPATVEVVTVLPAVQ